MSAVQADFDRIALLPHEGWNHNRDYHAFLLKRMPASCGAALDVGCGTGAFSRLLAERFSHVLALDLSPRMIARALACSTDQANIDYRVADAASWPFPVAAFDCVASIATLHHLPLEGTLRKMAGALRPGGILAILDLYEASTWQGLLTGLLAFPVSAALRLVHTGRLREPRQVRLAWEAHGHHDIYPTLPQVRSVCEAVVPGAQVRRHLLWRYSIIWRKPA